MPGQSSDACPIENAEAGLSLSLERLTAPCAQPLALSALAITFHSAQAQQPLKCRWRWWLSGYSGDRHLTALQGVRLLSRHTELQPPVKARDGDGRRQAVFVIDRFLATRSRLESIVGKIRNRWRPPSVVSADSKETEGCMIVVAT
jgi:hypothetical protein